MGAGCAGSGDQRREGEEFQVEVSLAQDGELGGCPSGALIPLQMQIPGACRVLAILKSGGFEALAA